MTEISKMFENAGVEHGSCQNYNRLEQCCNSPFCDSGMCPNGIGGEKNPFTVEKQIELIKWLAKIYELSINWVEQYYNSYRFVIRDYKNGRLNHSVCGYEEPFEETLAYLINRIWQSLTNQEKEEIRNILK